MDRKIRFVILLIFLIGLFFRTYQLDQIPTGFHDDELDAGYIGRYIFTWGEDIKGNLWPVYYDKLEDFRPAGIFYLSGLSTFIFGVNEFAVRFPSALFGSLTILAIYFFSYGLFRNRKIALFTSILFLLSPWHIVLSRATSEGIIGLFFVLIGLTTLNHGLNTKKSKFFGMALISFFISYLFYHSLRVLIPLAIIPFIFFGIKTPQMQYRTILLLLFFTTLTLIIGLTPWGHGRFTQIAFFKNPSIPNTIDKLIFAEGPATPITLLKARIFHNFLWPESSGLLVKRIIIFLNITYFSCYWLHLLRPRLHMKIARTYTDPYSCWYR